MSEPQGVRTAPGTTRAAPEHEIRRVTSEMERSADELERRNEELDQIAEAEQHTTREDRDAEAGLEGEGDDDPQAPEQPPEVPG